MTEQPVPIQDDAKAVANSAHQIVKPSSDLTQDNKEYDGKPRRSSERRRQRTRNINGKGNRHGNTSNTNTGHHERDAQRQRGARGAQKVVAQQDAPVDHTPPMRTATGHRGATQANTVPDTATTSTALNNAAAAATTTVHSQIRPQHRGGWPAAQQNMGPRHIKETHSIQAIVVLAQTLLAPAEMSQLIHLLATSMPTKYSTGHHASSGIEHRSNTQETHPTFKKDAVSSNINDTYRGGRNRRGRRPGRGGRGGRGSQDNANHTHIDKEAC